MAKNSTVTFEIIIIVILIIALVIISTLALDYSRKRLDCFDNPSPWCFRDWECPDQPEGKRNVWTNIINEGLVGTESTAKCWPGPSNGNTPNLPATCDNAWPFLDNKATTVNI